VGEGEEGAMERGEEEVKSGRTGIGGNRRRRIARWRIFQTLSKFESQLSARRQRFLQGYEDSLRSNATDSAMDDWLSFNDLHSNNTMTLFSLSPPRSTVLAVPGTGSTLLLAGAAEEDEDAEAASCFLFLGSTVVELLLTFGTVEACNKVQYVIETIEEQ
jgi:hypothetical protein